MSPEQAARFGIYFVVPLDERGVMAGGTTIRPLDVALPNVLALAEYRAYRDEVGPPPGTIGQPDFLMME